MPYTLVIVPVHGDHNIVQYYNEIAALPRSDENAGVDLITCESWGGIEPHLLDLGVRAMLVDSATKQPVHYWLLPRSSIYKTGYFMANSVGVIDKTYRGILKAPVLTGGLMSMPGLLYGHRHFQIVAPDMGHIERVVLSSELPETARGHGGFGSTGK
jgi:dUTPase